MYCEQFVVYPYNYSKLMICVPYEYFFVSRAAFYEEVWFFGVAAVGGALIIAIVIVTCCICICCCCKCAKADGKYYSKYIIIL